MICQAVPDAAFAGVAAVRAAQLASGPTMVYRALKQALRGAFEQNLDAQLALEARLQGQCKASVYFHKGIGGVFEKSGPRCFMASGPGRLGRINPDIKRGTAAAQRQRRHLGKTGHRRVWRPFGTGPRDK